MSKKEDDSSNESRGSSMMSKIVTGAAVAAAAVVGLGGLYAALSGSGSGEPHTTEEKVVFESGPRKKQKWTSPDAGWMKFNVDGSFLPFQGNSAACGGVMRDAAGTFIIGFARNLGSCDPHPHVAELWGIVSAMELAWTRNVRKLIIETDSEAAVGFVKEGCSTNKSYFNLVSQARKMLTRDWDVRVGHIDREGNRAANCMAKKGRSLPLGVIQEYLDPPEECVSILKDDLMGVSFPRLL